MLLRNQRVLLDVEKSLKMRSFEILEGAAFRFAGVTRYVSGPLFTMSTSTFILVFGIREESSETSNMILQAGSGKYIYRDSPRYLPIFLVLQSTYFHRDSNSRIDSHNILIIAPLDLPSSSEYAMCYLECLSTCLGEVSRSR